MLLKSIRFKIVFWYTVMLLLVLALFSILVYASLRKTLNNDLNDLLQLKAEGVTESIETYWETEKNEGMATGAAKEAFSKINNLNFNKIAERWVEEQSSDPELLGIIVSILGPKGEKIASSRNLSGIGSSYEETLKEALLGHSRFETRAFHKIPSGNSGLMRVFTMPVIEDDALAYIVQVAIPMSYFQNALNKLRLAFFILLPLVVVLSGIAGVFLAELIIKPLNKIISSVRRITSENLKLRIKIPDTNDEIKELVDTFNAMLEKLDESFSSQRQLIQDVSHELRTPLTIMRGEMDVALKKARSPEEYIDVLQSCLEEIIRLTHLVENLLILSRFDSREAGMDIKAVPLLHLVKNIVSDVHMLADNKGISIKCSGSDEIIVKGDEHHLRRALLNIIDNAIKYTNNGGSILIKLEDIDNQTRLKISDSGIGIIPENLPFIFDRFFRVDKSRSSQGYGLGLSISKSIIEAHRGSLSIESIPGLGTTVIIDLPD
jgi:two-component system OmpR family sensor kinase